MSKPMFFIKGFLPRLIFIATCCSILFACADQAVNFSNEATPLKNKQNPLLIYPEEIYNKSIQWLATMLRPKPKILWNYMPNE